MVEAEGKKLDFLPPSAIETQLLETFAYDGVPQEIHYHTDEFSAVCPFSGLPDIASVDIYYIPRTCCLELKSLKYYFVSFRQVGIFQEHVTNRLFSDLWNVLKPRWLKIITRYNTRGGIDAVCTVDSREIYPDGASDE